MVKYFNVGFVSPIGAQDGLNGAAKVNKLAATFCQEARHSRKRSYRE